MTVPSGSRTFDAGAAGYAATMAPVLRPVARRVVELAELAPGEHVLDIGTGTGSAAAAAVGDGRTVIGIDGAPGMIEIAGRTVPGATFKVMDFTRLEFPDGRFDALVASHSLLFASDKVATLAEWLRVTRPGGRLALSVPGPGDVTPTVVYREIYERHGISTADRYPTPVRLAAEAAAAGWSSIRTLADPTVTIRLADEPLFRTWRSIGSRGEATRDWTAEQHEALTIEMLAATRREPDGTFVIPFGALFLTAHKEAPG